MTPVFDQRIDIFGIPVDLIVLAIGVVGGVVGLLWLRRILTIEPETRSFRATAGRDRPWVAIVGAVIVIGLVALAIAAFVR